MLENDEFINISSEKIVAMKNHNKENLNIKLTSNNTSTYIN